MSKLAIAGTCMALLGFTSCTWDHVEPDVCFESEVLPIFVTYCSTNGCHNPQDREEGYDLTTYNGIMRGIRPNDVSGSKLLQAMSGFGEERMPPSRSPQPSGAQIATIKAWVNSGATNTTNCSAVSCDSGATVTYAGDILPMLENHCNGCHGGSSPSGGINLSTYANVKQYAQVGRLQGAMSGDPAYVSMPPNSPLLPSCYVTKIEQWVAGGAQNN